MADYFLKQSFRKAWSSLNFFCLFMHSAGFNMSCLSHIGMYWTVLFYLLTLLLLGIHHVASKKRPLCYIGCYFLLW